MNNIIILIKLNHCLVEALGSLVASLCAPLTSERSCSGTALLHAMNIADIIIPLSKKSNGLNIKNVISAICEYTIY